jgi:hypothetical protein
MRIFQNIQNLSIEVVRFRFPDAEQIDIRHMPIEGQTISHILIVSDKTDDEILAIINAPLSTIETNAILKRRTASKTARAIPSWATWTQAEADAWATTNIATPLATARTSLPATLTLATARAAFIVVLNILDKMWVLQKANAQMTLAIRDEIWPDLPER